MRRVLLRSVTRLAHRASSPYPEVGATLPHSTRGPLCDCIFVSDLHGSAQRCRKLFRAIREEAPRGVFLGGDLLPSGLAALTAEAATEGDFLEDFLLAALRELRTEMGDSYPEIFVILGNDDGRHVEEGVKAGDTEGLWHYVHGRCHLFRDHPVYGYTCVPPTPFLWKDWERYDVSRYVPPGSVSPEEGWRSVPVEPHEVRYGTIRGDLEDLTGEADLSRAVLLFHTPPYETLLDRAALDGRVVDYVPLDVHVGSIAVRRFIEERHPLLTLHGHIHESARLTGAWRDQIGSTHLFSAAHDGSELALIRFDLEQLQNATRELL